MTIKIIEERIGRDELRKLAEENFGTVIKIAVDVEKEIIAAGGEWH